MEYEEIFSKLAKSKFRSRFFIRRLEKDNAQEKGYRKIQEHAYDFIQKRLAPAVIPNDGKQTPMKGHPVFLAQHATATCCRGCLEKWYGIPKGRELTKEEIDYIVRIIMEWITRQVKN